MNYAKRINYSIDNVERSIAADNPITKKYTDAQKKKLYEAKKKLLAKYPALAELVDLRYIHKYPFDSARSFGRIGILPPELVISDDRIKDMCRYQFWTGFIPKSKEREMRFVRCPGVERHSSCPYFTPPAKKVREKLDRADLFIALQTKLFNDTSLLPGHFFVINRLREDVQALFGRQAVVQQFGAGPCRACDPEPCLEMGKCRKPRRLTPAMEAMGVPVGQLCRDMALVTGDKGWEIKWIKHWDMPNMAPKKWKLVLGLAVKLPA